MINLLNISQYIVTYQICSSIQNKVMDTLTNMIFYQISNKIMICVLEHGAHLLSYVNNLLCE